MIGPFRQRWFLPSRQKAQEPQGSFARAATRSPGRTRVTPSPTSTTRAAEFVPEELHGSLGLEPALDCLEGEGRDAEGELGLCDTGLDAERFGDHMARQTDRLRDVIEPHVAETVESPGFHFRLLIPANEFLERMAVGGNGASIAARRPGHLANVKVTPRIEAEVVGREEVPGCTGVRSTTPAGE